MLVRPATADRARFRHYGDPHLLRGLRHAAVDAALEVARHGAIVELIMSRMLDEIREQPRALERTLVRRTAPGRAFQTPDREEPAAPDGAGGARHLRQRRAVRPVPARDHDRHSGFARGAVDLDALQGAIDYRDALVVAISQSGESTDTNLVLERAREQGAITVGITNEKAQHAGAARGAHLPGARRQGKQRRRDQDLHRPDADDVPARLRPGRRHPQSDELRADPGTGADALELEPEIAALSERYRFMRHAVVVGRGLNYANAFELALKMMETCYVVAERFSSADFLHGPIALVEQGFPGLRLRALRGDMAIDRRDCSPNSRGFTPRSWRSRIAATPKWTPARPGDPPAEADQRGADADPVHRPGATLRGAPRRPEGPQSRPAADHQ